MREVKVLSLRFVAIVLYMRRSVATAEASAALPMWHRMHSPELKKYTKPLKAAVLIGNFLNLKNPLKIIFTRAPSRRRQIAWLSS